MRAIFETLFDIFYLLTVLSVGIRMIRNSKGSAQFQLFGWMAVVLGAGDSFHLVPRALALCTTGLDSYAFQLGLGKWITSVTMTVFYVLLYYVWRQRYHIQGQKAVTWAVYALSAARVILCMMPPRTSGSPTILPCPGASTATSPSRCWACWSSCCSTAAPRSTTTLRSAGCGSPSC